MFSLCNIRLFTAGEGSFYTTKQLLGVKLILLRSSLNILSIKCCCKLLRFTLSSVTSNSFRTSLVLGFVLYLCFANICETSMKPANREGKSFLGIGDADEVALVS